MNIQCSTYIYIVIDAKLGDLISQPLNELERRSTTRFVEWNLLCASFYVKLLSGGQVGCGHVTQSRFQVFT